MENKTVLITGASSGIGLEIAIQLMNKGMCVYAASRKGSNYQKSDNGKEGEIIPLIMDVNKEDDIKLVLNKIVEEKGHLDILICNAGNGIAGAIEDSSTEEIKYQFETNFFGTVKTIQSFLALFRKQGYGKIIATSSIAALIPIPFQAFYSASKAALSVFMDALTIELKPYNIQCSTLLPGDTKTEFTKNRKYTKKATLTDSVYSQRMKKAVGKMEKDEENGMTTHFVAKAVVKQLTKNEMKVNIIPGFQYKLIALVFNFIPKKLALYIIGKIY